jgi:beta-lactamase class A
MSDTNVKFLVGGTCGLIIGIGSVFIYNNYLVALGPQITPCTRLYSLTNQTLDCTKLEARSNQLQALNAQLEHATEQYVSENKAIRVSVFVRGLLSRQTAASNENDSYAPASLLKLPLMIAYYKLASIEPTILSTELTYASSSQLNDSSQDIPSDSTLVAGQKYTVEQLIEDMIINSDNNSTSVLLSHMDPTIFDNTLVDLGLKIPANTGEVDFVTTKTFANIFSQLYNASYLNRDYSQKALDLLTKSKFKAMAASLPKDIIVADKFGERQVDDMNGTIVKRELHDCGIVYSKSFSPYSICVMTEGTNFTDLESIIKDLSLVTYNALQ